MNVFSRGIRNAFRNPIRTTALVAILGLSIGLALAMLVAYKAVGKKIESVKGSVGNTISISPAGLRGFDGGGSALKADDIKALTSIDHITTVNMSLSDRLTTENSSLTTAIEAGSLGQRFFSNNGEMPAPPTDGPVMEIGGGASDGTGATTRSFTPPITAIGTTNPTDLSSTMGGGTFTLKSGEVFTGDSTENVALVGSSLATKNSLTVGSTFTAYGKEIKVVGIFDAGNTFSNNQVIMPLASLQALSDQAGDITSATVTVDSVSSIDATTATISSKLGTTADVTNGAEAAKATVEPLENIRKISLYSLIGAVIAGAAIILMTMIMIVRERRREIGVTKAIGASNINVMLQFAAEAVTLTLLAAIIGIIIGVIGGRPITKMLVDNSSNATTQTAGFGPGGSFRGGPSLSTNGSTSSGDTETTPVRTRGAFRSARSAVTDVTANVGWYLILYGLGAALVIALLGSVLASFFIAKIRPAEVMRAE
jgi:putative ABC transport system permease protein